MFTIILKSPIRSWLIDFLKLRNQHSYIILNASYKEICVEFERETNNTTKGFSYFQIAESTKNILQLTLKLCLGGCVRYIDY